MCNNCYSRPLKPRDKLWWTRTLPIQYILPPVMFVAIECGIIYLSNLAARIVLSCVASAILYLTTVFWYHNAYLHLPRWRSLITLTNVAYSTIFLLAQFFVLYIMDIVILRIFLAIIALGVHLASTHLFLFALHHEPGILDRAETDDYDFETDFDGFLWALQCVVTLKWIWKFETDFGKWGGQKPVSHIAEMEERL